MADEIDLTTGGTAILDNGTADTTDDALFKYLEGDDQVRSGTGLYDPFLATRSDGSTGVAEGFNSDADALLDTDAAKTSSLQIETLTVVTIDGVDYYTFRLDLNESPDKVSLNSLKLFTSAAQG